MERPGAWGLSPVSGVRFLRPFIFHFPFSILWRFANACTGRLRYGTGSGSDLAPPGAAATEAPGRYRSLYRTGDRATFPYTQSQTDLGLSVVIARNHMWQAMTNDKSKMENEK